MPLAPLDQLARVEAAIAPFSVALADWLSKCRALLVRYDKLPETYLGLLQLPCTLPLPIYDHGYRMILLPWFLP